jgi:hypothetical protein
MLNPAFWSGFSFAGALFPPCNPSNYMSRIAGYRDEGSWQRKINNIKYLIGCSLLAPVVARVWGVSRMNLTNFFSCTAKWDLPGA